MAKLWPFGKYEVTRRGLFKGVALVASGFAAKSLIDKISTNEEPFLESMISSGTDAVPAAGGTYIDVREFKKTLTVEELCRTSERYFAATTDWTYWLAKPLAQVEDAPDLLSGFAQVLNGLRLLPGMTELDFGAGSGWASRWL